MADCGPLIFPKFIHAVIPPRTPTLPRTQMAVSSKDQPLQLRGSRCIFRTGNPVAEHDLVTRPPWLPPHVRARVDLRARDACVGYRKCGQPVRRESTLGAPCGRIDLNFAPAGRKGYSR